MGVFRRVLCWRNGPHVTDAYEPRQVRKEAAVSKAVCVMSKSIPPAGYLRSSWHRTKGGARPGLFIFISHEAKEAIFRKCSTHYI